MKLKNFNFFIGLLFIFFILLPLRGEDQNIDIWSNKNKKKDSELENNKINNDNIINNLKPSNKIKTNEIVQIEKNKIENEEELKIFGVHDPEDYNFDLNMWSSTNAEDIRSIIKRIEKINLSKTSNEILENILLSFSYPPIGMNEKEFVKLKIDWLIKNDRHDLIENFLKQNKEFDGKRKLVQFLVDENISNANLKEGCEKIEFIDSTIKDPYLEKFKIYCFVFNNKDSQARLLLDILREENQSDKFFDDKINYLLGISDKTSTKINEKNLLNFYLSSVTIKDFDYQPTNKTKKEIWKYLNSANLIKLDDINDKNKLKDLEIAANRGQIDPKIIFDIYKQINFNLSNLINAKNTYQTLDNIDSRALIYQKFLLSENNENKIEYLFLLDDLFKKDKIENIYSKFLSENLKKIGLDNIPDNYQEISQKKILDAEELKDGKIKYNDKVLHQSKVLKYFTEAENQKKVQKDLDKLLKKFNKNKRYFFSAKDLALISSLIKDGFEIPSNFNYLDLADKYEVPKNLVQLIKKEQNAFLALKIVEIIGEDEPHQLDPETIFFITSLLNETNLIQIRNKVLISALPQRI